MMVSPMERGLDRVVALVDMDCFYVQVEQRLNPALRGQPCAVVQYKGYQGGGIIAVSYEARACGVTRNMRGDEARKLCPTIKLARVPEAHGKADLTRYREASVQVIDVMSQYAIVERASIDEAYVELTAQVQEKIRQMEGHVPIPSQLLRTFVEGWPRDDECEKEKPLNDCEDAKEACRLHGVTTWLQLTASDGAVGNADLNLSIGATIIEEMRAAIEAETGFRCSAGIAHNKMLAKLACGLNKPNRQTILPHSSVPGLFSGLPLGKIRNLGGKLGTSVSEKLGVEFIGDVVHYSKQHLEGHFGEKISGWLYDVCRGLEFEPIRPRNLPKSIGCSKNFNGPEALDTREKVRYWLKELATELEERLVKDKETNQRVAKQLTVGVHMDTKGQNGTLSRCSAMTRYDANKIAADALALLNACNTAGRGQATWSPAVTCLQLSACKFSEVAVGGTNDIAGYLSANAKPLLPALPKMGSSFGTPPKSVKDRGSRTIGIAELFQRATAKNQQCSQATNMSFDEGGDNSTKEGNCKGEHTSFFRKEALSAIHDDDDDDSNSQRPDTMEDFVISTSISPTVDDDSAETTPDLAVRSSNRCLEVDSNLDLQQDSGIIDTLSKMKKEGGNFISPEDMENCNECGKTVSMWELPEHSDFHFAQSLQKTFSASCEKPGLMRGTSMPASQRAKRRAAPPAKRKKASANHTLDSFFKKSS
uniref:DNA polymerase eta n=1 Tax=Eptatretus burgeri TaxID=7764 RepID=A0A8C4NBL4_EPTBU